MAGSLVEAAVNGQPIEAVVREPATVRVDLPILARGRQSVVELWYSLPAPPERAGLSAASLRPPVVEATSAPRRLFWQLGLPDQDYVLVPPANLASDMIWSLAPRWGRRPSMTQLELESWIGASRQDPLPRGINEYLFSALGRTPPLEFTSIKQRTLLLAISGLVLIMGLLLLHTRLARRPETLLAAAVCLTALAIALPETALLTAEAGVLGLVIVLVIALWNYVSFGRSIWPETRSIVIPSPNSDLRSTEVAIARSERASSVNKLPTPSDVSPVEAHP
jgi:hypothetical protein